MPARILLHVKRERDVKAGSKGGNEREREEKERGRGGEREIVSILLAGNSVNIC